MNQYMLLIRNEGFAMANLSEKEIKEHMGKWGVWFEKLKQSGNLEGGLPFSPEVASVVSNHGDTVTKGFHAESNNVNVGGYVLINATNHEEAVKISKGCPALEGSTSTIEVRECMDMTVPA